uniref:Pentatricopeptide repeat-containing protein n=1 Tax=Oryza rufipogon TaxID=4529 RepID=A0A0E0QL32_ORYRU
MAAARAAAAVDAYQHNTLIRAAADHRSLLLAFRAMLREGVAADHFTFPFALKALAQAHHRSPPPCAAAPATATTTLGCLHAQMVKSGHGANVYAASALVHAYVSRADAASARAVFDAARHRNVVTWTAMIAGHAAAGEAREAVALFREAVARGQEVNGITVAQVMGACAQSRDLESGRWVHATLRRWGVEPILLDVALATAVLHMYASCGGLDAAFEVFDKMPRRNEVSWNAMAEVCSRHGRQDKVLEVFPGMHSVGMKPDKVTWLSILRACTSKGAAGLGQGVHAYMEKTIGHRHVAVCTSLMDMYSKIGNARSALQIFQCLKRKDLMAWTSMIIGLAKHGHGKDAVQLFNQMQHGGVVPDHVAFVGVLTACSHAGMVDEARKYFDSMWNHYGIRPTIKHYGCMIDLFSRAGRLAEAEGMMQMMPIQPSVTMWGSMMNGCKVHGRADIAERVGRQVAELNPQFGAIYVIMSNIYAEIVLPSVQLLTLYVAWKERGTVEPANELYSGNGEQYRNTRYRSTKRELV